MAATIIDQDKFFSSLFQAALNNPLGSAYLPTLLMSSDNPKLQPFSARNVTLGKQNLGGVEFDITLDTVVVDGLANVKLPTAQDLTISGNQIAFTAAFSQITPPPTGVSQSLEVSANWTAVANFSEQADSKGSLGDDNTLQGTINLTIQASSLSAAFNYSGPDFQGLIMDFQNLTIAASTSNSNFKADVKIDGAATFFNKLITGFFQQPSVLEAVLKQLNQDFDTNLGQISTEITKVMQQVLTKKLSG